MARLRRRDSDERTRRRFVRRQWARRLISVRRVLVLVAVSAAIAASVWAIWFSSWLSVHKVEVHGTDQLTVAEVEQAAQVPLDGPLISADLAAVRTRVQALAMVASADVTRSWPDAVRIDVVERQAVAVVRIGGSLRGMDKGGVVFRTYRRVPVGLPTIQVSADTSADALEEAAKVVVSLPADVAPKVDHVDVRTIDEISLVLRDGRTVRWGSSADSDQKGEVLGVLLKQQARIYDVSVPARPTTSG